MKKTLGILLSVILIVLLITSCSKDDSSRKPQIPSYENVHKEPAAGEYVPEADFGRGFNLKIFYLDEDGGSIINPDDVSTYPILLSEPDEYSDSIVVDKWYDTFGVLQNIRTYISIYNESDLKYIDKQDQYALSFVAKGYKGKISNRFYVGFSSGEVDTLDVRFWFSNDEVLDGCNMEEGNRCWYPYITALYYNGTLVYTEVDKEEWGADTYVYITKVNGDTKISFTRP